MKQFFGKYRGIVKNNIDPLQMGRIEVSVPSVFGDGPKVFAMPCVPYAGKGVGFFAIPPEQTDVWVEFEGGDPSYPVWSGCFWKKGEVPAITEKIKILKTGTGTITLNDTPGSGGIIIETTNGMKIVVNSSGIEINNGQGSSIKLNGPKVSVNDGALDVI